MQHLHPERGQAIIVEAPKGRLVITVRDFNADRIDFLIPMPKGAKYVFWQKQSHFPPKSAFKGGFKKHFSLTTQQRLFIMLEGYNPDDRGSYLSLEMAFVIGKRASVGVECPTTWRVIPPEPSVVSAEEEEGT